MNETQLQTMIEKAMETLLGGNFKTFDQTLTEIKGWGADNGRLKQAEDAIKQLEEQREVLLGDIEQRMQAAARRAFTENGQYRGSFGSETEAREFALNIIRLTAAQKNRSLAQRCNDVLKNEHKDFHNRVKDITGDDALIPHEHSNRVHRLVEDYGVFARFAYRMPMSSDTLSFTRRTKGFRARKLKVRSVANKQDMGANQVNLTADKFAILTSYPLELEEDSLIAVAEMIIQEMGLGFAIALDEDAYVGDGTSDYDNEIGLVQKLTDINGIDDGGGLVRATGTKSGHWEKFTKNNFLKGTGQARFVRPGQGRYYGSSEFFWSVMAPIITDAGGRTVMESQNGITLNFFGTPYEVVNAMPRVGAAGQVACLYGDIYQAATLGSRRSMTVRRSPEVYFTSEEIAVMATERYALNIHDLGDADTAGPVIGFVTQ